jgi:hypothetical protein
MPIDNQFWDGRRWNGHVAFDTVEHTHVCCYFPAEGRDTCDIMVVGCKDGRWYVEDNWGGDANGAAGVWNPFDPSDAGPQFFLSEEAALVHAVSVVAAVSGVAESELSKHYLDS